MLTVLNPKGRDPEQRFARGPGLPDDPGHAPINFHAYAACAGGVFHVDTRRAIAEETPVLVLIRRRLRRTLDAVRALKAAGRTVWVSWKESGVIQVSRQLGSAASISLFREIVQSADGVLSANDQLLPLYRWAGNDQTEVRFLPTPYPVDFPEWDFSRPVGERKGVFIGTRSFRRASRAHLAALSLGATCAKQTGSRLTVINTEGGWASRLIEQLGIPSTQLRVSAPLPYPQYLRLMAEHRIVLQCDLSSVPGQVAGDALLCRMPCVGGNGVIDRLGFPGLCGGHRSNETLGQIAQELLTDDSAWQQSVDESQATAKKSLSFAAVSKELEMMLK